MFSFLFFQITNPENTLTSANTAGITAVAIVPKSANGNRQAIIKTSCVIARAIMKLITYAFSVQPLFLNIRYPLSSQ